MRLILRLLCFSAILLPVFADDDPPTIAAVTVNGSQNRNVLSNEGIVLLADAGYGEAVLIDTIAHKQTNFDTTIVGLAYLANHGISERIIRTMIANERKPAGPVVRVEALVPSAPPVTADAHMVRQTVLVPSLPAYPQPALQLAVSPATLCTGTSAPGSTVQATAYPEGAGAVVPVLAAPDQPAVVAPYTMVESPSYGNQWYIVSPSYVPVVSDATSMAMPSGHVPLRGLFSKLVGLLSHR